MRSVAARMIGCACACATLATGALAAPAAGATHSVLMIAVDDLRPVGELLGEPEVQVPTLSKLAARSTVFANAWVQAATCGVSRSSLLTGRRPDTTQVWGNGGCPFTNNPKHKDWQSMPEYFKNHGYTTVGMGKVFHPNICEGALKGEWSASWSLPYYHAPCISLGSIYNGTCFENYPLAPPGPYHKVTSAYANATGEDEDLPDGMIAAHAVDTLATLSKSDKKFFMAVGFHKPHLPHIAPKKYFDLYENISLPTNEFPPKGQPALAWNKGGEFKSYADNALAAKEAGYGRDTPFNASWTRWQRQAYFAAASFMDAQLAKVMDALDANNLADSTIVMLWGDHGWHLGENNEWAKHTAFRRANHAPLMFHMPGAAAGGIVDSYAEFVDIMPTIAELAGLPSIPVCKDEGMSAEASACTEGQSLAAAVLDPTQEAKKGAFYQWPMGGYFGYTVVTQVSGHAMRYTEWVKQKEFAPQWADSGGAELYNYTSDMDETVNIASLPGSIVAVRALSKVLHAGWRGMAGLPPPSPPPPPGPCAFTTVVQGYRVSNNGSMASSAADSSAECCSACGGVPSCGGYVFNAKKKMCYLMDVPAYATHPIKRSKCEDCTSVYNATAPQPQ